MNAMNNGKPERYISFRGIDCTAQSAKVMEHLYAIIDDPAKTNAFWERFKERAKAAGNIHARVTDELCLLCSHTYFLEELFEEHGDEAGLAHLRRIEEECC